MVWVRALMTIKSVKARTAIRRTYMVAYALCLVLPLWAWFAPPAPVEVWAGRFAVNVWTLIVTLGAVVGFFSAWRGYIQVERASSGALAVGLAMFTVANAVFDGGDGVRAMYLLGSVISVAFFVPVRWYLLPHGYWIEPRPERAGSGESA